MNEYNNEMEFQTNNVAYRRRVFEKHLFREDQRSGEDVGFADRLIQEGYRGSFASKAVVFHKKVNLRTLLAKELRYGSALNFNTASQLWGPKELWAIMVWHPFTVLIRNSTRFIFRMAGFVFYKLTGRILGKQ